MTRLRKMMLEELQRRNFAKSTIQYYLQAVEDFAAYFHKPPDQLTPDHLRQYQAYLLTERKLQPRTARLHVCALRFFFRKTLKRPLPPDDIPYSQGPTPIAHHPDRGGSRTADRFRPQPFRAHHADGALLHRHAQCRDALPAGQGHR